MAALEEPAIEREGSSINRSSFDVETFCQRHLKCKECNNSYVDPIMLPCLHIHCPDCLSKKAGEKKRNRREERVVARDSLSASIQSNVVIQREGGERAGEEEGEDEERMLSEDEDQGEREREAGAQEVKKKYVLHGNEKLTAPHDCEIGDCEDSVSRPLSNIIHAAKLKEKLSQGKMECQKCKKDTAKWICNDKECGNIPLCDFCREAHRRQEDTEDHQVIKIDPEINWWEGMNRQTWRCSEHRKHLVDMYCLTHCELMCHKCCTIYHRSTDCLVTDVEKCYSHAREESEEEQQKVKRLKDTFKDAENRGENVKRSLETKRDNIIVALNERYNQLVEQLTVERDEAIAKANLICDLKKKEIDDHQAVLKRVTDTLEESLEFIKDFSVTANPAEFMFLKTQLKQRLDYLHDRYSTFDLSPADDDELYLKPSNDDLPAKMFGKIYSTPSVKNFAYLKHRQNKFTFDVVITVECRDISGGPAAPESVLPELKAIVNESEDDITDGLACEVKPNNKTRCYNITVPPVKEAGLRFIHVYQPRPYPLEQYYTQGRPFSIHYQ
uniref:B box-type domain-containing protein n=1 Tax=Amphimedon queenslandica TaxID=400682 RepID=A0A1X7VT54_AMPQE